MNTYKKYCPNVFVAKCESEHQKGDVIIIETRYGKENKHKVHNLIGKWDGYYFYSITREDGFNNQERAKRKVDKLNIWADSADKKSEAAYQTSNKDREFLILGGPIKAGHHSEKRHRKIIEQAQNNTRKSIEFSGKAEQYRERTEYWESMANKIDLSMPESLEYYTFKLEQVKKQHLGLKNGTIQRKHSFSLTYAKKEVNEIEKKLKLAKQLWL